MSKWEIEEASLLAKDLFKMLQLPAGSIVVIGCSTSEIQGRVIGKYGSLEIAETLYNGLMANAKSAFKSFVNAAVCNIKPGPIEDVAIKKAAPKRTDKLALPEIGFIKTSTQ